MQESGKITGILRTQKIALKNKTSNTNYISNNNLSIVKKVISMLFKYANFRYFLTFKEHFNPRISHIEVIRKFFYKYK